MQESLSPKELADQLSRWYLNNYRKLPWRVDRNPYRIWVSEVMLQQTTVAAVIPYYERFMARFPSVESLAKAKESEVLSLWAGLGYYSRARNLHKAAQAIFASGFPRTSKELLELPGFGPYTSKAVASLAFGESTGVLDGNVIRILSRVHNWPAEHWTQKDKDLLQRQADLIAASGDPSIVNQAMMELGATICTPKSPSCVLCPWLSLCSAKKAQTELNLPLGKPRRKKEIWHWQAEVVIKNGRIKLVQNNYAPFLRGSWLPPGRAIKSISKPKKFDLKHSITHHEIYVTVLSKTSSAKKDEKWVSIDQIADFNPSSLVKKTLQFLKPAK